MNRSISHIAFALAVMAASANYVFADGVDISNRCSLTDTKAICSWACGGFEPVFPAGEAAEKWRTFEQDLDSPVDLSLTPVIAYNLLVPAGPGRDFDTRLTLVSSTGERFSATAHIIPTLWQGVCFDMHSCTFLNDIASIEIAIRNLSDKPWDKARFSVDKVVAGKPLDLDFEVYGSAERFHTEGKAAVSGVNGCARIDFDKGDKVRIETAGSRNRIYNPELTKRNTVAVTMTNLSDADSPATLYRY